VSSPVGDLRGDRGLIRGFFSADGVRRRAEYNEYLASKNVMIDFSNDQRDPFSMQT
jgi:hypothetical protein